MRFFFNRVIFSFANPISVIKRIIIESAPYIRQIFKLTLNGFGIVVF